MNLKKGLLFSGSTTHRITELDIDAKIVQNIAKKKKQNKNKIQHK